MCARIGEDGRGFEYILHGMNAERILIAAEAAKGPGGAEPLTFICPSVIGRIPSKHPCRCSPA